MKKVTLAASICFAALILLSGVAQADIVADAEGQTVGSGPGAPWGNNPDAFVRDDGTATPFGAGNQFIEAGSRVDGGGGGFRFLNVTDAVGSSPIERIQFQAYMPTGEFQNLFRLAIRGDDATNSQRALRTYNIDTVGGNLTVDGVDAPGSGTLAFDTVYNFDIIANISGSTFNSGGFDVADRTFDLFINGVQVEDNLALNQNSSFNTNINEVGFWQQSVGGNTTNAADQSSIYIDNVQFTSLTAVPEPTSILLIGLALSGIAVRRQRN